MILQTDHASDVYDFSFTAASLRLSEMRFVAEHLFSILPTDFYAQLGNGKESTGKRMFFEYNKRLKTLSSHEIDLLVHGDLSTQRQIAFISVCRSYAFIRDFTLEVIREKYLLFDYQINESDYSVFFRNKSEAHPELESITELTTKKIKQVTFKILEQAGIIDNIKTRNIQIQLVDRQLINAVVKTNKNWLKLLLVSDYDVQNTF